MPLTSKEIEKEILADGWILKSQNGSHRNYIHPYKTGKVTIPFHKGTLPVGTEMSIRKQAGLKGKK
jgi:predicted RNA binding protein YcfA (HicA-like mRNA interferase family)